MSDTDQSSADLTVTHVHGDHLAVSTAAGLELLRYVYRPDPARYEAPKPYAHPLRTTAGNSVSGYRPNDHRWHKGLQMTASHLRLGDHLQNFWGGHSYVHGAPGHGYLPIEERVGSMRHDGFDEISAEPDRLSFTERLTWVEHGGAEWCAETRRVAVHSLDDSADGGSYAVDWSINLRNLADAPLHFGSPTTAGRELAGYTGLHWRAPRDFTGARVLTPAGESDDDTMMGAPAAEHPWLAVSAEHDGVDAHSTVVFAHAPENTDPSGSAIHPSHWFVRSTPIPTVAFSWAFWEEFGLRPGAEFGFRYRVLVADGAWESDRIEHRLKSLPW
jgi:hypothetical protein